jgi:hypothetical protein
MKGFGANPPTEEMLMMRPRRSARMCGRTALVMRMAPKTLTSNTRCLGDGEFLGGAGGADAGVVDQHVDAPELIDDLPDHGGD